MAWEVSANDESGLCHLAQFHNKRNAEKHFEECLAEYVSATPPYEINDEYVEYFEDTGENDVKSA